MALKIGCDDIISDVAGGGREVAPRPETLAPVALTDVLELPLDLVRRAALCHAHEVANRDMRRYLDEEMHVIARQSPAEDRHAQLRADLPDDVANPDANVTPKDLVAVLRNPHDVIAMMENCVTAGAVRHSRYPRESETSRPAGGLTFPRIPAIGRVYG